MQSTNYEITELNLQLRFAVEWTYIRVFAGAPWYEVKKCSVCDEAYGRDDDLLSYRDGITCRNKDCGSPLTLIDYWAGGTALTAYLEALSYPNFAGFAAVSHTQIIGFVWGYNFLPHYNASDDLNLLLKNGIDAEKTAHLAEVAILDEFQGQGIGSNLALSFFRRVRDLGFVGVHFHTINQNLLKIFARYFGDSNITLLEDNPRRSSVRTYYVNLKHFRENQDN